MSRPNEDAREYKGHGPIKDKISFSVSFKE